MEAVDHGDHLTTFRTGHQQLEREDVDGRLQGGQDAPRLPKVKAAYPPAFGVCRQGVEVAGHHWP